MSDDPLPPGYSRSTPEQKDLLRRASLAAAQGASRAIAAQVPGAQLAAMAVVFVMPDGTVTAALVGEVYEDRRALARLLNVGPETLRLTVLRFIEGRGESMIVPR